jgi:hypothetical protein
MRFIEEVAVEEFLPTFRALLAADLRDRGLTQSEVADLLGISQSAVSKYANEDVTINARIAADERVADLVERLGAGLADGSVTPVQALAEAEVLIREMERGDLLASLHEESFPPLAAYDGEFAIHDPDSRVRESERVLASVRRGVRALENTAGFAALIPAVGSNLVEALPEATTIDDVAAVPGRVLDVKGRATVPAEPDFGVSAHVASVLLAARRAGSDARAALNVRYDPDLLDALRERGAVAVEFDATGEADTDALEAAIADALADAPDADVLYQTGGFGIEPVAYVLAADAVAAAETVRSVA